MWLRVSLMEHLHGCVTLLRAAFIVKLVQLLNDNRAYYGVCEETRRKR